MTICEACETWTQFLEHVKNRSSPTAFGNWIAPIEVIESSEIEITLKVPNIFFKEYLLSNFKKELPAPFDQEYMRALFDYGYQLGGRGYNWAHKPPDQQHVGDEEG